MELFVRLSPNHELSTHICYISAQTHGFGPLLLRHQFVGSTLLYIVKLALRPRWPLLPENVRSIR